jgi:hypothetical protein
MTAYLFFAASIVDSAELRFTMATRESTLQQQIIGVRFWVDGGAGLQYKGAALRLAQTDFA